MYVSETEPLQVSIHKAVSIFKRSLHVRILGTSLVAIIIFVLVKSFVPPLSDNTFPKIIRIPSGTTVRESARILESAGIINSPILFKNFIILLNGEGGLHAGDYYFKNPESSFFAAIRFTRGDGKLDPVKITIPEGRTSREIAKVFEEKLTEFDTKSFLKKAQERQGYLFPETYYFAPTALPEDIIGVMETTFSQKIAPLMTDIEKSGRSLKDVIIMASILEREARTFETKQMIAGILWKRLSIGMPLQVDAAFDMVNGTTTFGLTLEDLRTDHPYNTYTNRGLPPGPIANPGLESIQAAVSPTVSSYLYYLTDRKGIMRYARTHDEHVQNKALYLR